MSWITFDYHQFPPIRLSLLAVGGPQFAHAESLSPSGPMAYDRVALFARASELLEANLGMELRELARQLKVHRHTLESVIRAVTGWSFIVWRRERRLATAQRLLREAASLSEKEVAALCGLTASSLDRLFQRHCGVTPTEFRQRLSGANLRRTARRQRRMAPKRRKRTRG
jgi:AraC-like DNA-binding protein